MRKFFEWLNKKRVEVVTATAVSLAMVATSASAEEPPTMQEQVTTAVQSAVNDTISLFMAILPIALSVFAVTWGVRRAMRFFKSSAN